MDRRYIYGTAENRDFLKGMTNELLEFGRRFPSPGGSSYYLGDDGEPRTDRNRETWITSRMIHVYSIGSMLFRGVSEDRSAEYRALAEQGFNGLTNELQDRENGGWYAGLTPEGGIVPGKQCYAHAFVILAAASATVAGVPGADSFLDNALNIYDRYFWSEADGLAYDNRSTDMKQLDSYRGLNANMHTVEAFLAVADITGRTEYLERAAGTIEHVIVWAEKNCYRLPEHFNEKWEPDYDCNRDKPDDRFKPYGATPGHGIEWARLIAQWAQSRYKAAEYDDGEQAVKSGFNRYIHAAEMLYNRAVCDAWNADGEPGIVYTTDWTGRPVVHDRMHWTLAEAINTSSVLFRITGKDNYANDYSEFMKYLDEKVRDRVNGSWFHQMDRKNRVIGTVWPGKSDLYHAFQATLIPYLRTDLSIAEAVREKTYSTEAESGGQSTDAGKGNDADVKNMNTDVVALGELLIDFTENGNNESGNPVLTANPGGAPCNVLAMLSKLGKRTAFIGKVGKDSFGDFLCDTVEKCGIITKGLLRDEHVPTTLAFVHTVSDGDRSFSFYRNPGADMMLDRNDIDFSLIRGCRLFHFGTLSMTHSSVEDATRAAVDCARSEGKLISFDPNYRPLLWDNEEHAKAMMAYGFGVCDILKIADDEITFFTGCDNIDNAIDSFVKKYPNIGLICVTLGKEGSIGITKKHRVKAEPYITGRTIETTGAGDTFMACVLNYVLEHDGYRTASENINGKAAVTCERVSDIFAHLSADDLSGMLKFANTAASIITTRKGALKVMPERSEIERVLLSVGL